MTTDFFEAQDRARKQTGRLVMLFIFGMSATMLSLWAVAATVVAFALGNAKTNRGESPQWAEAFGSWELFVMVIVIVGLIVGIATLVKLAQLSQGGSKIAEMLGGVHISPGTRVAQHRELLNIVEEMSIASGVPVPPVYLIDSPSINAFAAGPDPSRSVIGVTTGCVKLLSRDELQGVIAHEYSHIFHGDTRINARTTAVIAGIMAIGMIGYVMFRFIGPTLARSSGGKKNPGPALGLAVIVLGLLVWAIGSLGMLFGRMIQAAISRQREFLADSAAVQYTRNADGIGGALAKIRDHSARIESPAASELNHFFFCSSLDTLFATHPPINERIQRIVAMGANALGARETKAASTAARATSAQASTQQTRQPSLHRGSALPVAGFAGDSVDATSRGAGQPSRAIANAGTLDADALKQARQWRDGLPPMLRDATHDSIGARALCYAVTRRNGAHEACDLIVATHDGEAYEEYSRIAVAVMQLRSDLQMALIDLAAPMLFELGVDRYRTFRALLAQAVRSDGSTDLRDWSLLKSLERNVERRFINTPAKANKTLAQLHEEARRVLATAASTSHGEDSALVAFRRAYSVFGAEAPAMPVRNTITLDALSEDARALAQLNFPDRARLLEACAMAVSHDGDITPDEHLVVRSLADALDVPLPAMLSHA